MNFGLFHVFESRLVDFSFSLLFVFLRSGLDFVISWISVVHLQDLTFLMGFQIQVGGYKSVIKTLMAAFLAAYDFASQVSVTHGLS